jgi:hypothetical protein
MKEASARDDPFLFPGVLQNLQLPFAQYLDAPQADLPQLHTQTLVTLRSIQAQVVFWIKLLTEMNKKMQDASSAASKTVTILLLYRVLHSDIFLGTLKRLKVGIIGGGHLTQLVLNDLSDIKGSWFLGHLKLRSKS